MDHETIGKRITRLRTAKGWSRPKLANEIAPMLEGKSISGEMIRLYETDKNRPSPEVRAALAKIFDRSEVYMEFGTSPGVAQLQAAYTPERDEFSTEELALVASYRKADPRWRLSLRLLAALADPDDQIEAATDVNMVVARILGKKSTEVRYASDKRVEEAFGEAPHVAQRKVKYRGRA